MTLRTVLAAGAAVLALGLVFLAGGQAADEKGPRDDVDKLTELGVKDPERTKRPPSMPRPSRASMT